MKAYILHKLPRDRAAERISILDVKTRTGRANVAAVIQLFLAQGRDVAFFTSKTRLSAASGLPVDRIPNRKA